MAETGQVPGSRAVIWGDTALAKMCAKELERAGIQPVAQLPGDQNLELIEGEGRIAAVTADGVRYECDLLVISRDMVKS